MKRRRRKGKSGKWLRRASATLLAVPVIYLLAAFLGSLVPVNRNWKEPEGGTTVYLADNGIHTDIVMPIEAQGLDWSRVIPASEIAVPVPGARWIAFGAGEEHVYLDTPTWWDLTPRTVAVALIGGPRVMHVEHVASPGYAKRAIRLRPEEYRRLWASIRAEFALDRNGQPQRINHPGYGCCDAFYRGVGKASAFRTCNSWVADRLRIAGVKTSLWPPFGNGLAWRYRQARP